MMKAQLKSKRGLKIESVGGRGGDRISGSVDICQVERKRRQERNAVNFHNFYNHTKLCTIKLRRYL